jgi:rod shape-determining protein MreD
MISLAKRGELLLWDVFPALLVLGLFILCLIPQFLPGFAFFLPLIFLIPVFFWAVYDHAAMPFWFVGAVGLVVDAATGQLMGLSALTYMCFLAVVRVQRKYFHKEGFVIRWSVFALVLAGCLALQWLITAIMYRQAPSILTGFYQWFLTLCVYPLLHVLCERIAEFIQHRRWKLLHA